MCHYPRATIPPPLTGAVFSFKCYLDIYREKSHSWGQNNRDEDFPLQEYKVKALQNKLKQV